MKDEFDIVKASSKLFGVIEGILIIGSMMFHRIDLVIGFAIGYLINLVNFFLIVKMVDTVLMVQISKNAYLTSLFFIVRMLIYALGFLLAIKVHWINLYTLCLGYFVVKVTLHLEKYLF